MKEEGSEGDGAPTSRADADSTVMSSTGPRTTLMGGTTLASALLGIAQFDQGGNGAAANSGRNGNGDHQPLHSTRGGRGAPGDKQFTCNICHRGFGYKHVLQNHERTHTGEKPFECKECHKRFTRDHHLKTHMRLHTGEKPYSCSHCERQFVQVANLRRHLRVHTGERPYACHVCPNRFSDSNQLKAHLLIHEGLKPFSCEACSGKFRRRHHLLHHKCPMSEENAGKPKRGRRPKAYDDLLLPKHERTLVDMPVPTGGVIKMDMPPPPVVKREPPSTPPSQAVSSVKREPLVPQPAHMQQAVARRNHHQLHQYHPILGASLNGFRDSVQTGPLDMTVSAAASSAPVSVITHAALHHQLRAHHQVDGVLDLSNSRSDSDAEPIEEEVDEEEDDDQEGLLDSESEDEADRRRQRESLSWMTAAAYAWRRDDGGGQFTMVKRLHHGGNGHDNGGFESGEDENSNLYLQLTTSDTEPLLSNQGF